MSLKIKLSFVCLFFSLGSCANLSEFVKWQNISYKNLPSEIEFDG